MAISAAQNGSDVAALLRTAPERYTSLGTLLEYNKPDNRELLIETYGDQGITGFLEMVGAVRSAGTADQIQYWEEGRLHKTLSAFYDTSAGEVVLSGDNNGTAANLLRLNDVLLSPAGVRLVVTAINDDSDTSGTGDYPSATVVRLDGAAHSGADEGSVGSEVTFPIIGNIYAQGTGQPTKFYDTGVTKRDNDFFITKETSHVNGSQATNIGWING